MRRLNAIHINAFNCHAFNSLDQLEIYVKLGSVRIYDGAFNGLTQLFSIIFEAGGIESLPTGLFDGLANEISHIEFGIWPNNVNLNDMFATEVYRHLKELFIAEIEAPHTKFRRLAAINFTSFRRIEELKLIHCGIEVIDADAFDSIARWLRLVNLDSNSIKYVNLRMFRRIVESKWHAEISFDENDFWSCTCQSLAFDIMMCPTSPDWCYDCDVMESNISIDTCGIRFIANGTKLCIDRQLSVKYISIRLLYINDAIMIQSPFADGLRLIIVDSNAMSARQCSERVSRSKPKCLLINRYVGILPLKAIEGIDDAKLISVTAIPILYAFGVRPMHSFTVLRQPLTNEDDWAVLLVTIFFTVLGIPIGISAGIGIQFAWTYCVKIVSDKQKHDYPVEYAEYPVYYTKSNVSYAEIDQNHEDGNYIDVIDTEY